MPSLKRRNRRQRSMAPYPSTHDEIVERITTLTAAELEDWTTAQVDNPWTRDDLHFAAIGEIERRKANPSVEIRQILTIRGGVHAHD